ncbi:MAG: YtxH domain-containing protein [Anaerolineae bacterium]
MSDKGGDFLAGFVLGGLVGAAVALLLAPQPGEETRALLRERSIELRERADELSAEARKLAAELQEKGKETLGDQIGRVKEAVEEGKTAAQKAKEDLLRQVQTGQKAPEGEAEA